MIEEMGEGMSLGKLVSNLLIFLAIIFAVLFLIFYVLSADVPNHKTPSQICQEQCIKQDMNFYRYNTGGYQNPACLCKTKGDGLIKTIYTE